MTSQAHASGEVLLLALRPFAPPPTRALTQQNKETGLPQHRQSKLEKVFKIIDKAGTGKLSLRSLQVSL